MGKPKVAVAIPAFNEADGIGGFLREIDRALADHVSWLRLVVVDDASTDATAPVLEALARELRGELRVLTNPANRGHGPSLIEAYRRAVELAPDFVLQVDGDGQFHGSDLRRLLVLLLDEAHAVSGVRRFRQDPWFRMAMTRLLRRYVSLAFSVRARDPNCPLRGYETSLLDELLSSLPADALIPNLYLTVLAFRRGVPLVEVDVSHRVRRGATSQGSTWGAPTRSPIPWRLVAFSLAALRDSMRFRAQLRMADRRLAQRST
jgi:glycosyltransferase involved in cell wall biosynthesis